MTLTIHHIGARGGYQPFPLLKQFEGDIQRFLYDADADCISTSLDGAVYAQALPWCFADKSGSATFHLNFAPDSSSLRALNPEYAGYYTAGRNWDRVFEDMYRTMEERQVITTTLDETFFEGDASPPPPDFLSLDTQGTEYEILQGGRETLAQHVLGLIVEVSFHPLYQEQKLFGEVCRLLDKQGFHFVELMGTFSQIRPFRAPVGLRGKGFQTDGDALFLRKISSVPTAAQLRKLAFIALVFHQTEYALLCLQQAPPIPAVSPTYERFLAEFWRAIQTHPLATLPKIGDLFSYETLKSEFTVLPRQQDHWAKAPLRRIPWASRLWHGARSVITGITESWSRLTRTPVEKVLGDYGLTEQARHLKQRRLVTDSYRSEPT